MKSQKRILITDDVHPILINGLGQIGQVDYFPNMTYEQVCDRIGAYSGLVINSKIIVNREFLTAAHSLHWIGRLGSGLDVIDLEAAARSKVHILNSPEGNSNAVGEHALAMLLALLNKICLGDKMVRSLNSWNREQMRGSELDGLTIGVIGCGHTGSAFVKKLRGFDVTVLIYDKYKKQIPAIHRFQKEVSLNQLLDQSDVVSIHLPLTEETKWSVNDSFMRQMKPGSILINTSRGTITRLQDLVFNLKSGHLGGACLDVFENEKPTLYTSNDQIIMKSLATFEQVVLTPHVAGWTVESKQKIAEILLKKIIYVVESTGLV